MANSYEISVRDQQQGSGAFGFGAGQWQETFELEPDPAGDNPQSPVSAIEQILGNCKPSGQGGLNRKLPKAHPMYPWYFASSVSPVGVGYHDQVVNLTAKLFDVNDEFADLEADPIVFQYYGWPHYRLNVNFQQVPYAVLDDASIADNQVISWVESDGSGVDSKYATEWERFTDFSYEYGVETAYAQQGNYAFITGSGNLPGGSPAPKGGKTYSGYPNMTIPDANLVFYWYGVPYSYVTSSNSWLVRLGGRINQVPFLQWSEGQLRYDGYRIIRRYPPPVPAIVNWFGSASFDTFKLVDLELRFKVTRRQITDPPTRLQVTNGNYVLGGHNALPFLGGFNKATGTYVGRGFYYGCIPNAPWTPTYLSAPFSLLFSDPDA